MEYGAIDLHKNESQIRIVTEGGTVTDRRIATTRDRLTAMFWGRPRMRILVEASTESEWVAQHLETLGHEVVVADPNFSAMYGHRSRRIKQTAVMSRHWRTPVSLVSTARSTGDQSRNAPCKRSSRSGASSRTHGRVPSRSCERWSAARDVGYGVAARTRSSRAWPPWRCRP